MPAANPLAIFAPGLNAVGIPWAAVGSIASNAYGEFRTTRDVDLIALIARPHAHRFPRVFGEEEFYCPPPDVIEQEAGRPQRGHFNIIHHETMFKADIYIVNPDESFQRWALQNRRRLTVEQVPVFLAPPEYVIISKLDFFREGGSEKHVRDIRGMLAVTDVDRRLLDTEITRRGLRAQWRQVQAGAEG